MKRSRLSLAAPTKKIRLRRDGWSLGYAIAMHAVVGDKYYKKNGADDTWRRSRGTVEKC
jgi:hypothetical protein